MAKGQISVQTENIFPIIKKFLYSDQEIFLRELVSNAVDASSKLKTLSSKGVYKGELGEMTIDIILEDDKLIIKDRGIGMTEDEVERYLNQVAFSSAAEFLEKYKDEELYEFLMEMAGRLEDADLMRHQLGYLLMHARATVAAPVRTKHFQEALGRAERFLKKFDD